MHCINQMRGVNVERCQIQESVFIKNVTYAHSFSTINISPYNHKIVNYFHLIFLSNLKCNPYSNTYLLLINNSYNMPLPKFQNVF